MRYNVVLQLDGVEKALADLVYWSKMLYFCIGGVVVYRSFKLPRYFIAQFFLVFGVLLTGCSQVPSIPPVTPADRSDYRIGPGDNLQIFVWHNPDVSVSLPVRPDGKISTPLVEDLQASGKTTTELARDIEKLLATYIRNPVVTVILGGSIGNLTEQIRVVGEATKPQTLAYRDGMTLLDVMIAVGGLTEFADGDSAKLVRIVANNQQQYTVSLNALLKDGDISKNVEIIPGDILIIPEAWF